MPNTSNQNNSKVNKNLMNSPYMQNYSENRSHSNAGAGLPNSNRGLVPRAKAPMVAYPQPMPFNQPRVARQPSAVVSAPVVGVSAKKQKKLMAKQLKGRSDHFYLQRKGATFLILIFAIAIIACISLSTIIPMIGGTVKKPDYTPEDKRESTTVDGVETPYADKSVYYTALDSLMGTLKLLTKKDMYADAKSIIDADIEAGSYTEEEIETMLKSLDIYKSEFYDSVLLKFEENKVEGIMVMLFKYHSVAYSLLLLIALFTIIKCIASFFGKRIFKRFGLTGILVLIIGGVILFSGYIGVDALGKNLLNKPSGETNVEQSIITNDNLTTNDIVVNKENGKLNLAKDTTEEEIEPTVITELLDFVMGAFSSYPDTTEEANAELPTYVSGLLPLILVAIGIAMLFVSFFAKRKVSYAIFESIK